MRIKDKRCEIDNCNEITVYFVMVFDDELVDECLWCDCGDGKERIVL